MKRPWKLYERYARQKIMLDLIRDNLYVEQLPERPTAQLTQVLVHPLSMATVTMATEVQLKHDKEEER